MGTRQSTIAGDGVNLAVWSRGDESSPTVVLVHGYPDDHTVWDGVAERLATDHHVVAYDVRGTGESGGPAAASGYRLEHLVADLGAVIDRVSPQRPIHLVGHDWGSIQSWEAVCGGSLDGRIASFTSISGPCLDHVAQWMRSRRGASISAVSPLVRQGLRSWYIAAFQIPGLADLAWRTVAPGLFTRYLARVEDVANGGDAPASTLARNGRNGLELYRQNVRERMAAPRARTTDLPVQLIVPTGDRFVTPALLDDVCRYASQLTRHDVDGTHWIVANDPDRVALLVRAHVVSTGT